MKRVIACSALLLGAAGLCRAQGAPDWSSRPAVPPAPPYTPPTIERTVLSNGVPLLFVRRAGVPLVQVTLALRSGTNQEPSGKSGLATLTADLMRAGAGERSRTAIAEGSQLLGINLAARADRQSTQVQLFTPIARLDSALAMMADLALRPVFPEAEVSAARTRQVNEILSQRDQAGNMAGRALSLALYGPDHPEGQSTIGSAADVSAITREEIVAFHRTALRPDLATFIVVGDIALGDVSARLEAAFAGRWPASSGTVAPPPVAASPPRTRSMLFVDRPGAAQSSIRIVSLGPARSSPDLPALDVLNMVLGGSSTSRIERNLRARHGFAYEARSFFEYRDGASPFIVAANVETKATVPAVREILSELGAIRGAIPAAEVASARSILLRGMPERFLTVRGIAGVVTDQALASRPLDYTAAYLRQIAAVTPADAMRVARAYIDPKHVVVVIVGDWKVLETDLRSLQLGAVRVLRPDQLIPPAP